MKIKTFEKLSEKLYLETDDSQMSCVIMGLQMLASKFDAQDVCAEHDEIFAGGESPEDASWTDDELKNMARWGWRWENDTGSWAKFT